MAENNNQFRIGDWTVDPIRNVVSRGSTMRKLDPRAVEVLVYLAARTDTVVPAAELMAAIWQNRTPDETQAYKAVARIRKALGDSADQPRIVETIPKRGYRIVATVCEGPSRAAPGREPPPAARRDMPRRLAFAGLGLALLLGGLFVVAQWSEVPDRLAVESPALTLAVLPFNDLSADSEYEFIVDGMHDSLLTRLAKVDGLDVISRTSVLSYRETTLPLPDIAAELGAAAVVEGSARVDGDGLRLAVRLIDAATDRAIWSEVYERPSRDLLALEPAVAADVARALVAGVSPAETALLLREPTDSAEAYSLFLRARTQWHTDIDQALRNLERALAVDPGFAAAHALKARILANQIVTTFGGRSSSSEALDRMVRDAATKALEIDPTIGMAYGALGLAHRNHWRWQAALDSYERGMQVDPSFVSGPAWFHSFLGNHDRAVQIAATGIRLNPRDATAYYDYGMTLAWAGRARDAIDTLERAVEIEPGNPVWRYVLGRALLQAGRRQAALDAFSVSRQLWGEGLLGNPIVLEMAYCYGRLGAADEAHALVESYLERREAPLSEGLDAVIALARRSEADALAALARVADKIARNEPDPAFFSLMVVRLNELRDPLLETPDFVAARQRLGGT